MSSVGSFFSYVNDARSHEPEAYVTFYFTINFKQFIVDDVRFFIVVLASILEFV